VYLIFALIYLPAFAPIAGAKNPDHVAPECKSNRNDPPFDFTETVVSFLVRAVGNILCDDTLRVGESELRYPERDSMFSLILSVLVRVPFEADFRHDFRLACIWY
jgi:hypothetical protein